MNKMFTQFVVWCLLLLFVCVTMGFQSSLILPQRRRYFGNGELKTPQEIIQTDKYQNSKLITVKNVLLFHKKQIKP